MMAIPFAVDRRAPTLSRWLDHFDHAVGVMGIDHVGLGADFVDQVGPDRVAKSRFALDGFAGPEEFPSLAAALEGRGYEGLRLEAIMSRNWLRVLRQTLTA
jgi:membrane dipeptidase